MFLDIFHRFVSLKLVSHNCRNVELNLRCITCKTDEKTNHCIYVTVRKMIYFEIIFTNVQYNQKL